MGKKAEGDHTPGQRAEQPTPDDDVRWLPIEAAHQRLTERTGDLATLDLMKALEQGRLHCMARSTVTGERKLLAPAKWTDRIMLWPGKDGVRVVHRHQPGEPFPNIVKPVRGCRYYVWQPDFETVWPPPAGSAQVDHDDSKSKEPVRAIDRAKAVLPVIYPPDGEPPRELTLKAVTKAVAEECESERRGWKPPSEDRVHDALEQLGYRPPRKRQPPRKRK
jgi:hypothetical protein